MNFKNASDLCDVASCLGFCTNDQTIMLVVDGGEHWIPSVKISSGLVWERTVSKEMTEIFGISPPKKILRFSKYWIPRHAQSFLIHVVFQVTVDTALKNKTKNVMGKYRGKIRWLTQTDLYKLLTSNSLRSPELVELFHLITGTPIQNYTFPEDINCFQNFSETSEEILVSGKATLYQQLVDASRIDKLAQESILKEFIVSTFPTCYMNVRAFSRFVLELGWSKDVANYLFFSADLNGRYGLSFRELLYFLAAVDPNTAHGGPAAELRCKYMFRYYDRDRDSKLKFDEFKNVVSDLRKSKKLAIDPASVMKESTETFKGMGLTETSQITVMEFLKAICDLKIRGTSAIFRSNTGIIKYLQNIGDKSGGGKGTVAAPAAPVKTENLRGKMTTPSTFKHFDYEVAVHSVIIQKCGQAINVEELKQIQEAVSLTTLKQPVNEQNKRVSMDIFSQRSVSNEVLRSLRYVLGINNIRDPKAAFTWGQLDSQYFTKNLMTVCNQVKEVFRNESRLLVLSSPIYILGDLHGNVSDLLEFEKVLWHLGPGLSPCNLLFLGDYVDRGPHSIEVISYLFSYKLQCPQKLFLIRGNHEIRDVQKMFTFLKECKAKLGEKLGTELWNTVNNAFDSLPVSAVIDGKLFCCHGGIPPPWLCPQISTINDIPVPLNQPDVQSSLAWELMWNDPVKPKTVNDKLAMELIANEGFASNQRRGTAHIFSGEALEKFLKSNGLTHLVRAHEVAQAGIQVQQKGRLLTVFSSSKYCGGQNNAACVMADQGKLRILRLEVD